METRKVYIYTFNTMSDWEIGHLIAELNTGRFFKKEHDPLKIVTVGIDKNPIITMGGLKVIPDISLEDLQINNIDTLILPGGETWTSNEHESILNIAMESLNKGVLVGAICGATIGLSKKGILNNRNHTSNDLEFLKMIVPNYQGEENYINTGAVADQNLITASGICPLEFTVEVLKYLDVLNDGSLKAWFNLYNTRESKYFFELMNS